MHWSSCSPALSHPYYLLLAWHYVHGQSTTLLFHPDSRFLPRQWEILLQSSTVSHWLGAKLESALWHISLATSQPCHPLGSLMEAPLGSLMEAMAIHQRAQMGCYYNRQAGNLSDNAYNQQPLVTSNHLLESLPIWRRSYVITDKWCPLR